MGLPREFEELHSLVQVALVGALVLLDRPVDPMLFGPPLRRLAVEEGGVDPAVKFVHVHRVQPVLQLSVFGLKPANRLVVVPLLVLVALPERLGMLQRAVPRVPIGPHCMTPYECPFMARCWATLPPHHVSTLYAMRRRALELDEQGYRTIYDLPEEVPLGPIADRQRRAVREGRIIGLNFMQKFQQLIDEYNAGAVNVELFFNRLVEFAKELNEEEKRTIAEDLDEEELAVFDILTRPDMKLSAKERNQVKKASRDLLATLKREKLVLDWPEQAAEPCRSQSRYRGRAQRRTA